MKKQSLKKDSENTDTTLVLNDTTIEKKITKKSKDKSNSVTETPLETIDVKPKRKLKTVVKKDKNVQESVIDEPILEIKEQESLKSNLEDGIIIENEQTAPVEPDSKMNIIHVQEVIKKLQDNLAEVLKPIELTVTAKEYLSRIQQENGIIEPIVVEKLIEEEVKPVEQHIVEPIIEPITEEVKPVEQPKQAADTSNSKVQFMLYDQPVKVDYHKEHNYHLGNMVALLNVLGKPYYDQLVKQGLDIHPEIHRILRNRYYYGQ